MVLESCHWSGEIKDKIQIRQFRADHQRHRGDTPITLAESCLGQQEAGKAVGDVIHRSSLLILSGVHADPSTLWLNTEEGLRYRAAFLTQHTGQLLNRRRMEQRSQRQFMAKDAFNLGKQPYCQQRVPA
jgi:hypothetical protein